MNIELISDRCCIQKGIIFFVILELASVIDFLEFKLYITKITQTKTMLID